ADLVARPALGPPGPHLPQPLPARLLDDRKHGEALQRPGAGHLQETPPCGAARQLAADMAARLLVGEQFGVALEIPKLRRTQHETRGFNHWTGIGHGTTPPPCKSAPAGAEAAIDDQNALMPVSSRPTTSWCTVSVPS